MRYPSRTPVNARWAQGKVNKELVFVLAIAAFVVVSIVGMMLIDDYGQRQMGTGVVSGPE